MSGTQSVSILVNATLDLFASTPEQVQDCVTDVAGLLISVLSAERFGPKQAGLTVKVSAIPLIAKKRPANSTAADHYSQLSPFWISYHEQH